MEALKHAAEQAKSGHGQIVAAMAEAGRRQVAAVLRVQGDFAIGLDGAGDVLGLARQGQRVSAGDRSAAQLLQNCERRRRANAPREGHGTGHRARSQSGRHAALPVQPARHRRGRRSAGADGRADQEAAHAGGDQAHPAARVAQSAADGDLRGPPLDRRADPGVAESARRLDRHREDPAAGELPARILTSDGAARPTTRSCGSTRSARRAPRRC